MSILRERFGIIGERLTLMGQGIDASPVIPAGEEGEAKSVGHSTTLKRDISERGVIKRHILKLSEMVGARARRYGLKGRKVALTLRYHDFFTFSRQKTIATPTNDTRVIYATATSIFDSLRLKSAIRLVGVAISDISKGTGQLDLFEDGMKREKLLKAIDEINKGSGEFTITWASICDDGADIEGSGVSSPSWRPEGVKRVEVR